MTFPPQDDIDRIMAVMERAFDPHWGEAWTRRQVEDSLRFAHTHYYLLPDGDGDGNRRADAFALVRSAPGEEEVLLLAVTPDRQRRGLGRQVLHQVIAAARAREAESLFLEMRENNPAADFYRAAGFEPIGRRKGYYRTGNGQVLDAVTLRLAIASPSI
ncbi:GNAT family N-acetyltransferase [Erythrobacter sp. 3-20A1M]|uniref:GNAT family N-acetyltransferase n=1 Tax=Erythrobacter sp. 3-20A1M TaxID=2653850 RepID=UPI001BFC575A|nr:GNAT family N-acetyltransferase [Erythrobacter sp. 3-20A1M]QWC55990.1 GNAT family N-acetyltransferase [Erythrobacter sp. 3-20A1M]